MTTEIATKSVSEVSDAFERNKFLEDIDAPLAVLSRHSN